MQPRRSNKHAPVMPLGSKRASEARQRHSFGLIWMRSAGLTCTGFHSFCWVGKAWNWLFRPPLQRSAPRIQINVFARILRSTRSALSKRTSSTRAIAPSCARNRSPKACCQEDSLPCDDAGMKEQRGRGKRRHRDTGGWMDENDGSQ